MKRLRLPDGLIPTVSGILALAAFCAAGFIVGMVFWWAWLWLGLLCVAVSLFLVSESFRE